MANRTGWDAIGYGLAGGFEKDEKKANEVLDRKQRQEELTALQQGYELDEETNSYVPTANKQTQQDIKEQKLTATLDAIKAQMGNMQAKTNFDDMNSISLSLINGNFDDAKSTLNKNTLLKTKLRDGKLDAVDFSPIDWENDGKLLEGTNIKGINQAIDNQEVRKALNSTYFKVQGKDGNWRVTSTDMLNKATNLWNNLNTAQRDMYTNRVRNVNSIISGAGITSGEQQVKETKENLDLSKNQVMMDAIASGDSTEVMEALKMTNPELFTPSKMKTNTRITSANLKDEYANLVVKRKNKDITPDETTRLGVLHKLFSTDFDDKSATMEKGMQITAKYKENLFGQDVDSKDIKNAKLYSQQSGIKPSSKSNTEFKDQYAILKNGQRLVTDIEKLQPEDISRGIYDVGIQEFKKLLSDKSFLTMSTEDQKKALASVSVNTKLGMFLAKYIKSISGTAVAEGEYRRLSNLFSGSSFDNIQSLKAGVTSFVEELDKSFRDNAEINLLDNPATTLDLVQRYNNNKPKTTATKQKVNRQTMIDAIKRGQK